LAAASSSANALTAFLLNDTNAVALNATPTLANFLIVYQIRYILLSLFNALPFQVAEAATNILATMPPS
jgi:hypothetical protein